MLLEERLSHPVLQDLLPSLGGHLHDVSERVRLALLDLLILIKGMRSIKVSGCGQIVRRPCYIVFSLFSFGVSVQWIIC